MEKRKTTGAGGYDLPKEDETVAATGAGNLKID